MLLPHPIDFWLCFHFHLYSLISTMISSVASWLFSSILFGLRMFVICTFFFPLKVISSLMALWSEKIPDMISVLWMYWALCSGLACDVSWRMFLVHLRRMCAHLLQDRMFYIYPLSSWSLMCPLRPKFGYFLSGWSVHWCKWCVKIQYYHHVAVSFSPYVC